MACVYVSCERMFQLPQKKKLLAHLRYSASGDLEAFRAFHAALEHLKCLKGDWGVGFMTNVSVVNCCRQDDEKQNRDVNSQSSLHDRLSLAMMHLSCDSCLDENKPHICAA